MDANHLFTLLRQAAEESSGLGVASRGGLTHNPQ